mmetsp:Transcript_110505/g.276694  ORF Transcript_110505/g.276694 Transcript_110505/m.276694 type:complete len:231 (+) Transcript_110505:95-787(+)
MNIGMCLPNTCWTPAAHCPHRSRHQGLRPLTPRIMLLEAGLHAREDLDLDRGKNTEDQRSRQARHQAIENAQLVHRCVVHKQHCQGPSWRIHRTKQFHEEHGQTARQRTSKHAGPQDMNEDKGDQGGADSANYDVEQLWQSRRAEHQNGNGPERWSIEFHVIQILETENGACVGHRVGIQRAQKVNTTSNTCCSDNGFQNLPFAPPHRCTQCPSMRVLVLAWLNLGPKWP